MVIYIVCHHLLILHRVTVVVDVNAVNVVVVVDEVVLFLGRCCDFVVVMVLLLLLLSLRHLVIVNKQNTLHN